MGRAIVSGSPTNLKEFSYDSGQFGLVEGVRFYISNPLVTPARDGKSYYAGAECSRADVCAEIREAATTGKSLTFEVEPGAVKPKDSEPFAVLRVARIVPAK